MCHTIRLPPTMVIVKILGFAILLSGQFYSSNLFLLVEAVLAGAIVIPHGDFAYDPTLLPAGTVERRIAQNIAVASRTAGHWLFHNVQPDVLFLSTPHGIQLDTNFAIFMSKHGTGTVTIGGDLYNTSTQHDISYNLTLGVELAPTLAQSLLDDLTDAHQNVSGLYSYNEADALPLQWGEIVPLSMIFPKERQAQNLFKSMSTPYAHIQSETAEGRRRLRPTRPRRQQQHQGQQQIPVLIWSNPERRYDHAPEMVPELLRLGGQYLLPWMEARPERIGVVISSDLSHTHQPQGPYGYSNASAPFDAAMGTWAMDPCSVKGTAALLETGRQLQTRAKSCGFTGLVLLHGLLCSSSTTARSAQTVTRKKTTNTVVASNTTTTSTVPLSASSGSAGARSSFGIQFQSTVLANHNVTYYGMMAATFALLDNTTMH
jgi:aromatic ring-opening dioxygenase LigB subunit